MREADRLIKIDDVMQLNDASFKDDQQKWIDSTTFLIVSSNIK